MKALYFMQKAALTSDSSSSSNPIKPTLALAVAAAATAAEVSNFDGVDLANDPDAVDADDDDDDIITDADARLVEQRAESEKKLFRGKNEPALLDPKGSPFEWWRERAAAYPLLSVVARKWLAVPASSAASERMFSSAGLTVSKKRTCLKKERVSTLVFLKTAWPALEAQGVLYGADSKCRKRTRKQT
jgi:hAT family C-terminal dimerisation region